MKRTRATTTEDPPTKAKASSNSSDGSNIKSNLEVLREENISRNAAFLQSLGLAEDKAAMALQLSGRGGAESKKTQPARKKIKKASKDSDDGNYDKEVAVNDDLLSTRRSTRLMGVSATATNYSDAIAIELDESGKTARAKVKPERSNYDFDFDNDFEEGNDDTDYVKRERITANSLREFIFASNSDHSDEISDEQVSLCVYRIQSMSSKRLATRIKMIARAAGKHSHEKLLVFYYGLIASNLMKLAEIAKEALVNIGVILL